MNTLLLFRQTGKWKAHTMRKKPIVNYTDSFDKKCEKCLKKMEILYDDIGKYTMTRICNKHNFNLANFPNF